MMVPFVKHYAWLNLIIVFLLRSTFICGREIVLHPYEIHRGWTAYVTSGNYTTASLTRCAVYTSIPRNSLIPLATYNKTSSSCKTTITLPQNIFLDSTGNDNDIVLMDESICTHIVHAFKMYEDTDYWGNDYPTSSHPTVKGCASYCEQNYPDSPTFMYQYSTSSLCLCKKVTRQEHIDMGNPIAPLSGWNYYERLC